MPHPINYHAANYNIPEFKQCMYLCMYVHASVLHVGMYVQRKMSTVIKGMFSFSPFKYTVTHNWLWYSICI